MQTIEVRHRIKIYHLIHKASNQCQNLKKKIKNKNLINMKFTKRYDWSRSNLRFWKASAFPTSFPLPTPHPIQKYICVNLWLQLYFMLTLFHYKKCCICFNSVPCILWDFIVLGLVLSRWRIEHVLNEQVDFTSVLQEAYPWKSHVRSTCWKLKSRARLSISRMSREKDQPMRYLQNSLLW